jgi:trehalose-6-phosphatase
MNAESKRVHQPDGMAFYSPYNWCLNPVLTLRDIAQRLEQEIHRQVSLKDSWQRAESFINIYLFLCAATCVTDDYLADRPWKLRELVRRLPRFSVYINVVASCLNFFPGLISHRDRHRVYRWRQLIGPKVDEICELLAAAELSKLEDNPDGHEGLLQIFRQQSTASLPQRALSYRMRIPEGYRCQDLSHHDVLAMAARLLQTCTADPRPILVVGPRTAGGYFAPLICAYLRQHGRTSSWITIRPKDGLTSNEREWLKRGLNMPALVAVVDDHPNSGNTFSLIVTELRRLGAKVEDIIIVAPEHPAQADWTRMIGSIRAVTLPHASVYNRLLLDNENFIAGLLRDFYRSRGWSDLRLVNNTQVDAINAHFSASSGVSFQVRLKHLFEVELIGQDRERCRVHVLAKSVGLGWLGYHAILAADQLSDFVPPVLGLRHGLMFLEWVGSLDLNSDRPAPAQVATIVPKYVAARVSRLPLIEDPSFGLAGSRATGWDVLVNAFRRPYGSIVGRLQSKLIRSQLKQYRAPFPTLIDGELALENWVRGDSRIFKTDFEHHNFGGGELDLVDPALDLASAIHHLRLDADDERTLVATYEKSTKDVKVAERLLLAKLISGLVAMQKALYRLDRKQGQLEEWNRLYNSSRDFLTFQMNRYCAGLISEARAASWSDKLFLLDLDGVFDWTEAFGQFPQTTPNGVMALRLLQSHGYAVVPNTARSIAHVRDYCHSYGMPGGIAEYGCVFVDAVAGHDVSLIDDEATDQLAKCRKLMQNLPGVFTDPGYEWTVRAYRFYGGRTHGLNESEVTALLKQLKLTRLRCIFKGEDTYILPHEVNKGAAVLAVKRHLGLDQAPTVAIGDSYEDLEMLKVADMAYMPANACRELRALSNDKRFHLTRQPRQRGLLAAVRHLTRSDPGSQDAQVRPMPKSEYIIEALLRANDQPRSVQFLNALRRRLH